MSRRNKVNPDHYTTAGRLSPDDLARERKKQAEQMLARARGRDSKPMPPWMANEAAAVENALGEQSPRQEEPGVPAPTHPSAGETTPAPVRGQAQGRGKAKASPSARRKPTTAVTKKAAKSKTAKPKATKSKATKSKAAKTVASTRARKTTKTARKAKSHATTSAGPRSRRPTMARARKR